MTIFRILESDLKERIAVKKGFCWPAAIFGVLWALFKKFWPGALVLLGVFAIVRTLPMLAERTGIALLSYVFFLLLTAVLYLIGRYANIAFTAYLTTKGYRVVADVEAASPDEALRIFGQSRAVTQPPPGAIEKEIVSGPMGLCPNCDTQIPQSAAECVRCKVQFGPGRAWQIKPMKLML